MAVNPLLDFLRRIRASDLVRKTPDAELLARFVASHDEVAFAGLVQRHGPMVYRLCVRVLGNAPDSEDAFQAVFLVLARRASSVSRPELLGNWLYGVGYRTALKLRDATVRRQTRVMEKRDVDGRNPADEAAQSELRHVLDHEVSRLPDRYRVPVVLHYLEGYTQAEVAKLLGCPCNTITTRLARACERLRGRLTRRGLALSGGGLAAALSEEASAAMPAALIDATVKAAMLFVAGGSTLPSTVVFIAEGVIRAMFLTKVKFALAGVVLLGAVVTAAGVLAHQGQTPGTAAHLGAATPNDNANAASPAASASRRPDAKKNTAPMAAEVEKAALVQRRALVRGTVTFEAKSMMVRAGKAETSRGIIRVWFDGDKTRQDMKPVPGAEDAFFVHVVTAGKGGERGVPLRVVTGVNCERDGCVVYYTQHPPNQPRSAIAFDKKAEGKRTQQVIDPRQVGYVPTGLTSRRPLDSFLGGLGRGMVTVKKATWKKEDC